MSSEWRNLKEELSTYHTRTPHVLKVQGHLLTLFVSDDLPKVGHVVRVGENTYARVLKHNGQRHVMAHVLSLTSDVCEGAHVTMLSKEEEACAAFPAPINNKNTMDLRSKSFVPASIQGSIRFDVPKPSFMELDPKRDTLRTGINTLDLLSPLTHAGINLVIDASPSESAFAHIATRFVRATHTQDVLTVHIGDGPHTRWHVRERMVHAHLDAHITAIKALMLWAAKERSVRADQVVILTLPEWTFEGISFARTRTGEELNFSTLINLLGSALMSTKTGRITTLLRLPVHQSASGLLHIVDTLQLGDIDTQILIDAQGRYEPWSSRTHTTHDDASKRREEARLRSLLGRAHKLKERAAIVGDDMEQEELDALQEADNLRITLCSKNTQ